jgi:hypothetical protein
MRTKKNFAAIAICAMIFSFTNSRAGSGFNVSAGPILAFPGGDMGDRMAKGGFGGSVRAELQAEGQMVNMGIGLNIGYLGFGEKTMVNQLELDVKYKSTCLPILVGPTYYFGDFDNAFHIGAQLGVTMFSLKSTIPAFTDSTLGISFAGTSDTYKKTAFTYGIAIGYRYQPIDVEVGYWTFAFKEKWTDNSSGTPIEMSQDLTGGWTGIRVAFVFGGVD